MLRGEIHKWEVGGGNHTTQWYYIYTTKAMVIGETTQKGGIEQETKRSGAMAELKFGDLEPIDFLTRQR